MSAFKVRTIEAAELGELLAREEGQTFDCKDKRKKPGDLVQHVAGLANADGGALVIGLKDKKESEGAARINGFVSPEEANGAVSAIQRDIEPPVRGITFEYLDTGVTAGPLLLVVRVPRSRFFHRVGGKAYLRENAATILLDERRAELLKTKKLWGRIARSAAVVAAGVVGVTALFLGYAVASRPSLTTEWISFPTGPGLREEYDLRLRIGTTLGEGLVDVHGRLDLPVPVAEAVLVNAGGCEQVELVRHVLRAATVPNGDERPASTVELRSSRCPAESMPVVRLVADKSFVFTHDAPLKDDSGRIRITYAWKVPIFGVRAPFRPAVETELPAPNTQWNRYTIPTRAYPASISDPPYYDLETRRGHVAAVIDKNDYETLPDSGAGLAWIATPGARIRLRYEGGFIRGWVRWLPCATPIEVEVAAPAEVVGQEFGYRRIEMSWDGCRATIDVLGVGKDDAGNTLIPVQSLSAR